MLNNYYLISVILLIVLLFYPVNKLIFVLSIRRLEKKIGKSLNKEEKSGQLKRSRFISLVLLIIFSCLFNINLININ
jgi:hypothetical protein